MFDIFAQLNPAAWVAIILLIALGFLSVVVLKLVKSGKAKSPKDLVQVARDRAAAAKATKEAHKQAEAAIAEPVASSRLSRIGVRSGDEAAEVTEVDAETADAEVAEIVAEEWTESSDTGIVAGGIAKVGDVGSDDAWMPEPPVTPAQMGLDLADPANHPQNWEALVAVVDALEVALQGPWPEDRLLPVPRFEDSAADPEGAARAASQRQSAIQLARTINGAAREQAQEIIAVVREFAHQGAFSPQDCNAVMQGLGAIEWMALIERDAATEKRTLPLTRHDPEAPLWVHDAVNAIYAEAQRRAA